MVRSQASTCSSLGASSALRWPCSSAGRINDGLVDDGPKVFCEGAKQPGGVHSVVAAMVGGNDRRDHGRHHETAPLDGRAQADFPYGYQGRLVDGDNSGEPGDAGGPRFERVAKTGAESPEANRRRCALDTADSRCLATWARGLPAKAGSTGIRTPQSVATASPMSEASPTDSRASASARIRKSVAVKPTPAAFPAAAASNNPSTRRSRPTEK